MSSSAIVEPKSKVAALKESVRLVKDWPQPGIGFRDINPLIMDAALFKQSIDLLVERYRGKDIAYVAGLEARGYIWAAPLAAALNAGFLMIRKPSKLPPGDKISVLYGKEYGKDEFELYTGGWPKDVGMNGVNVLIVDDLLATGGSAEAACRLVEQAKGNVFECAFIIGLPFIKSAGEKLKAYTTFTLVEFNDEMK
jgi:adenine phosphoribosyltransferase